jgi:hypothetical protein
MEEAWRKGRFGSWLRDNSEIEFANGNFVSTSIILKNKCAGDGCRDKTIEKTILRTFRARTFSLSLGQNRNNSERALVQLETACERLGAPWLRPKSAMCGRLRVGKKNLHVAGLVGAAMCSAFKCGSHDRWP